MQQTEEFSFVPTTQAAMSELRRETRANPFRFDMDYVPTVRTEGLWVIIVTLANVAFSYVFACATPFAALGALAGTRMRQGPGLALVGAAWAMNQLIGYFILSYPRTWDSFAWGAAIGVAALLAAIAARRTAALWRHPLASAAVAFAAAFAAYEGALFAATAILPPCDGAFALPVLARILAVNAGAFVGLLAIQKVAVLFGMQGEAEGLGGDALRA